jgi:hypothetical protein
MCGVRLNASYILTKVEMKYVPYTTEQVKRFFDDLGEIGFPVEDVLVDGGSLAFRHNLSIYTHKEYLLSGLSLARCVWETGITAVADIHFQNMDENPSRDKYESILTAHTRSLPYANTAHMVIHYGYKWIMDKDYVLSNLKKTPIISPDSKAFIQEIWGANEVNA